MVEGDVCRVSAVQIGETVQAGESVAEINGQPFLGAAPAAGRLVFRAGFFSFGSGCFCFHRFSFRCPYYTISVYAVKRNQPKFRKFQKIILGVDRPFRYYDLTIP